MFALHHFDMRSYFDHVDQGAALESIPSMTPCQSAGGTLKSLRPSSVATDHTCCAPIVDTAPIPHRPPRDLEEEEWLRVFIGKEFERAREMNMFEPDWLPEQTLDAYARVMGLDRKPKPIDPAHIRIRIRRAREQRKLSQGQLAKKLGISQSALSLMERGLRTIHVYQLCAIGRALQVSLEWFVRPPDD